MKKVNNSIRLYKAKTEKSIMLYLISYQLYKPVWNNLIY